MSVKKLRIVTNLGMFSNLLKIKTIRNRNILAIKHAFTSDHKSVIEKYFHDLL